MRSRRERTRPAASVSPRRLVASAAVGVALIVAALLFAFARDAVAPGGYEVRAIFRDAGQLRADSAVRTGGLDIGKVTSVTASPDGTALVTMRIADRDTVLRTTDTLLVRARLAFEGNFYVDVVPGDPHGRALAANDTIPASRTSRSVQLDEVLSTLDRPVRDEFRRTVAGLADGFGRGADGTSGAAGLRRAGVELDRSLGAVRRAARASRGRAPRDLAAALRQTGSFTGALGADRASLADVVSGYSAVLRTFAEQQQDVGASLVAADRLLSGAAVPLRRIDGVLPSLRRVSAALRPALAELPATLRPLNRAFAQAERVGRPDELRALVAQLRQPVGDLPQLAGQVRFALPYTASLGACLANVVVPALNMRVPDGDLSVDQPAWLELLHAFSTFASGSPGFDGNGTTLRAGLTVSDGALLGAVPGLGNLFGLVPKDLQTLRPQWLGNYQRPARRIDADCAAQRLPDLAMMVGTGRDAAAFRGFRRIDTKPAGARETRAALQELRGRLQGGSR
ncbi:MlaD family protein [Patulibacter brassicae]|uniref:MlaD family protein n=1 Tax=Patulibacter brassicae TaxID=1705717 RepID=A0ABU4VQY2_9ACTN|nr:MlaD family protein [Patulibacter brassicae]MDX8153288.1 MlaD family protein [Patulibacter brassicae]